MIDVNDLRKGVIFELDGNLFRVLEYSFNNLVAAMPPSASKPVICAVELP